MMSFDYRLNPLYTIQECSSCGALYTTDYCCSNGSLVDKIICDLNKAPDSPHLNTFSSNQRHCFHCKDVLGDGKFCQRCTCMRCGSGLSKGLCLICKHNQNSLNDSLSISETSSQSPPHINHHCCYECGDPLEEFTTFSNILFDADYESDSSDDQSCSDEDVPEKIFSTHLFDEEIIPIKIDQHYDNVESDLIDSPRTHDSSLIISSKIDSLLDEFADELAFLKSISPRIDETDCDFEEDIRLIEKLLYDNSFPRPPKEFVFANSDAEIESFFPSPIPVEDSDSLIEEIYLSFNPVYLMPLGIKDDDYDSERDSLIFEDLPSNATLSIPKIKSF
nr:hypothetical protein [Tanacetum cinerariifolium]